MTPEEARAALAIVNKIGVNGTDASWAVTHRDEISAAFDQLQAFISEVERLQAENTALKESLRTMVIARRALYEHTQIWWNSDEEGAMKDAERLLANCLSDE